MRYSPPHTHVTVCGKVEGDFLRVDVIDEGPGIPPAARERIFSPFEQVGADRNREAKGAGLGLAIAKGIVEAHGGKIWIVPHEGPGAMVSFTIPLSA